MVTAKQEYDRFVVWLHQSEREIPPNVRRLANLVLDNFDVLAQTSRHRSQRTVALTSLLRQSLTHASADSPAAQAVAVNGAWPWKRLRQITLGPFRGFRAAEPFDLQKRIILFYGPNGSGKTSFCEGLEYALLGTVEDAENKRIDPRAYLANIHERRFASPVLKASDHQGGEVDVVANAEAYRFCFVEKNRIDAFSRIAARPSGQRAELIATLFGLDQFSDFVSHFNESMDGNLILEPEKERELITRRETLANDQALVDGEEQAQEMLRQEEAALAANYSAEATYAGLKLLLGSENAPGRLQELENTLNTVPQPVTGITRGTFLAAVQTVEERDGEVRRLESLLSERSTEISFKELYTAVLALQESDRDHCPACDTPLAGLTHVTINPYEKAQRGLAQLRDLAELQQQVGVAQTELGTASRALRQHASTIARFVAANGEEDTVAGRYLAELPAEPVGDWWAAISTTPAQEPDVALLEPLLTLADRAAAQDATALRMQQERQGTIDERDRLNDFRLRVQAQDLRRQQQTENLVAANSRIVNFAAANAELIDQVAQEKLDIERDAPIKAAYDRFLAEIKDYREQLPGGLMAGLNETAMRLYNEFNRDDHDADKLAELHLPLTGEDKIDIVFRGGSGRRVDALHVLSEGHVRCLGLAILLAKAKSIECPLVVFDDAINAIDHDHRGGIREAIFENDNFLDMQLVVTCHSNEFIKDIQQHLPTAHRNDCAVILFRPHAGDYQPQITRDVPAGNYIAQARVNGGVKTGHGAEQKSATAAPA